MQKVCLSLICMSVLTCGAHETQKFLNRAFAQKIDVRQYLPTQRPVEQDRRTRLNIPTPTPYIGGKQLEVNWTQLAHASMALLGIRAAWHAGIKPKEVPTRPGQNEHCVTQQIMNARRNAYDAFHPMRIFATLCTLGFGYKYLNGEQKNPFRLVDAPETVSTEESNQ